MKKLFFLIIFCALTVLLAGCKDEALSGETGYKTISPKEAKSLFESGKDFILVDVRRIDEYGEAHIPGAINIPNEDIGTLRPEALPDTEAKIIIYCRSGRRSKEAAEKLLKLGYTDVSDLGGIISWPYETVTGLEQGSWPTEQ